MKNLIFIPGLGERAKNYRFLSKYMKVLDIDWNNIKTHIGKPKVLVGFSLGAILAVNHAMKHKVDHLILCSMTPGVESLAKVKSEKVTFIIGKKEGSWMTKEIIRVSKTLKCPWQVYIVPDASHKINRLYRKQLLKLLGGS